MELTPGARARLDECQAKSGMTRVAMLSRLIEWYARQPETFQRLIVGHIPKEVQIDAARILLKRLERGGKS